MRIVIKVGTSTLAHATGNTNIRRVETLCRVLSDIKNAGHEVLLVSSGATGMGSGKLGLLKKPEDISTKQAAAAVGQCELMYTYDKLFQQYNHCVAQVLLTRSDIEDPTRRAHLHNTFFRLLDFHVLPVINENDSVATEEFFIGENDSLAALVSTIVEADLVVLLSDIDGLFTADPRKDPAARLIERVEEITPQMLQQAGGSGSDFGSGGMAAKLNAAQIAMNAGIDMVIANGSHPEILYDIIEGKNIGTRFIARKEAS
ncbi:MAG: glutamate 5-kinase [Lachnospiraceae bacterium]|nr:glutamate 5-kinase [Lachnospiraceae bacterium]